MKKNKPIALIPLSGNEEHQAKKLLSLTPHRQWDVRAGKVNKIICDVDSKSQKRGGKWRTITTADHRATLRSYAVPGMRGGTLRYFGPAKARIFKVPEGYTIALRTHAAPKHSVVLLRKSDGMDYHPLPHEIKSGDFAAMIKSMEANAALRAEQLKKAKEQDEYRAAFRRDLATTRVTIFDSRKAGNCVEGSLQFAESRLGIPRQEVINGLHLFGVSAKRLVDSGNQRALAAAWIAWERETTISI